MFGVVFAEHGVVFAEHGVVFSVAFGAVMKGIVLAERGFAGSASH